MLLVEITPTSNFFLLKKKKSKRYWQSEMDSLQNPTNLKKKRRIFEEPGMPMDTDIDRENSPEVTENNSENIQDGEVYEGRF